jgi:hypothetical protein
MSSLTLGKDIETFAAQYYVEAGACIETLLFGKRIDIRQIMFSYLDRHREYSSVLKELYDSYCGLRRTPEVIVAQNELLQLRLLVEDQHLRMLKRLDAVCSQNAKELEMVLADQLTADSWEVATNMRIPFNSIFKVIDGRIIPLVHVAIGNVAVATGTAIPPTLTISGIEIRSLTDCDLAVRVEVGIIEVQDFYRDVMPPAETA